MLCHDTERQLREVWAAIEILNGRAELNMAALDDLNTAVSALGTEVTTFLADIAAQLSGAVTADQAEAIVGQIAGFTSQLQAADPATPPAPSS